MAESDRGDITWNDDVCVDKEQDTGLTILKLHPSSRAVSQSTVFVRKDGFDAGILLYCGTTMIASLMLKLTLDNHLISSH